MIYLLVVLSSLCWALASIAGVLAALTFTQNQRRKFPILRRLDGKRLHLFIVTAILFLCGFAASSWKEILVASPATELVEDPSGGISRRANVLGFNKEIQDTAKDLVVAATDYFYAGYRDLASANYNSAAANFQKSILKIPSMAAYLNLGHSLALSAEVKLAEEAYRSGLTIAVTKNNEDYREAFFNSLGNAAMFSRNFEEGERLYKIALEISEHMKDETRIVCVLFNLGNLYLAWGRHSEAAERFQSAVALHKKLNEPVLYANTLYALGDAYQRQSQFDAALSSFQSALKNHELSNNPLGQANALAGIGGVYAKQRRFQEALKSYSAALELRKQANDTRMVRNTMTAIGAITLAQGKFEQGIEWLQRSLEIGKDTNDPGHRALTLKIIAHAYLGRGNLVEALKRLKEARIAYLAQGEEAVNERRDIDREIFWTSYWQGMISKSPESLKAKPSPQSVSSF